MPRRLGKQRDRVHGSLVPGVAGQCGGKAGTVPRGVPGVGVQPSADRQRRCGMSRGLLMVTKDRGASRLAEVKLVAPL